MDRFCLKMQKKCNKYEQKTDENLIGIPLKNLDKSTSEMNNTELLDVTTEPSTVEISYEEYLASTKAGVQSTVKKRKAELSCYLDSGSDEDFEIADVNADVNAVALLPPGKDIRTFFSKIPDNPDQLQQFTTKIKVVAEIHSEQNQNSFLSSNPNNSGKFVEKHKSCKIQANKKCPSVITDADLVIECLGVDEISDVSDGGILQETTDLVEGIPLVRNSLIDDETIHMVDAVAYGNEDNYCISDNCVKQPKRKKLKKNHEGNVKNFFDNCKSGLKTNLEHFIEADEKQEIFLNEDEDIWISTSDSTRKITKIEFTGIQVKDKPEENRKKTGLKSALPLMENKGRKEIGNGSRQKAKKHMLDTEFKDITKATNFEETVVSEVVHDGNRRSSRRSARVAAAAISQSFEENGRKTTKTSETNLLGNDDNTLVMTIKDCDGMGDNEFIEKSSRKQSRGTKLAPIFSKQMSKETVMKELTDGEKEVLRIKKDFLLSGVPEELRRQQNNQQTNVTFSEAPFPTTSHIQQIDHIQPAWAVDERGKDPWCLSMNNDDQMSKFNGSISCQKVTDLGCIPYADEVGISQKTWAVNSADITSEMMNLLIAEIKSKNEAFPVEKFYQQLNAKKLNLKAFDRSIAEATLSEDESYTSTWTDLYAPQSSTEMLGNQAACKRLRDWLSEWKQNIGRIIQLESNSHSDSSDFDAFSDDENSCSTGNGLLRNTILILGPHGIGKTAMVYALANELDFKIFEVNSSACRDGKHVLTQLQEATQSHQVSRTSQSCSMLMQPTAPNDVKSAKCIKQKKNVVEERAFASLFGSKNDGKAIGSSHSPSRLRNKTRTPTKKNYNKATTSKKKESIQRNKNESTMDDLQLMQKSTRTKIPDVVKKTSLILFDEVDIVLENDKGFWSAVQRFMKTTKRPIILTATDPNVVKQFGVYVEVLKLHVPRLLNTVSYLQLICCIENVRTNYEDMLSLVEFHHGDIRKILLFLQYWVVSGGGQHLAHNEPICYYEHCLSCQTTSSSENINSKDDNQPTSEHPEKLVSASDDDFQSPIKKKRLSHRTIFDDESNSQTDPIKSNFNIVSNDDDSQTCSMFDNSGTSSEKKLLNGVPMSLHRISNDVIGNKLYDFGNIIQMKEMRCENKEIKELKFPLCVKNHPSANKSEKTNNYVGNFKPSKLSEFDYIAPRIQISLNESIDNNRQKNSVTVSTNEENQTDGDAESENKSTDNSSSKIVSSSIKTLFKLYNNISYFDSYCFSMSNSTLLRPGDLDENAVISDKKWQHLDSLLDETNLGMMLTVECTTNQLIDCKTNQENKIIHQLSLSLNALSEHDYYSSMNKDNKNTLNFVRGSLKELQRPVCLDILPSMRSICKSEALRKLTNSKRRFFHHLRDPFPTMSASVMEHMCSAFS